MTKTNSEKEGTLLRDCRPQELFFTFLNIMKLALARDEWFLAIQATVIATIRAPFWTSAIPSPISFLTKWVTRLFHSLVLTRPQREQCIDQLPYQG